MTNASPILLLPTLHEEIDSFSVGGVRTWGGSRDAAFKQQIREKSKLADRLPDGAQYAFAIRAFLGHSRGKIERQIPDVENVPKLVVDAFTGILYEDDDWRYVRAVQVEGHWVDDHNERTEVFVYRISE